MKQFSIIIKSGWKNFHYQVVQMPSDQAFDYYKLVAKNKEILFRNNAPVLRKHRLKYRVPDWDIHSGEMANTSFKNDIIKAMNNALGYKTGEEHF